MKKYSPGGYLDPRGALKQAQTNSIELRINEMNSRKQLFTQCLHEHVSGGMEE